MEGTENRYKKYQPLYWDSTRSYKRNNPSSKELTFKDINILQNIHAYFNYHEQSEHAILLKNSIQFIDIHSLNYFINSSFYVIKTVTNALKRKLDDYLIKSDINILKLLLYSIYALYPNKNDHIMDIIFDIAYNFIIYFAYKSKKLDAVEKQINMIHHWLLSLDQFRRSNIRTSSSRRRRRKHKTS